jgi:hypothetical protein
VIQRSNELVIARIRRQAKRILAGKVKGTDKLIFPGFTWCDGGERPHWWREDFAPREWGAVIGVHEAEAGLLGAIVVTEIGLGVYNDPVAPTWVPYHEITGWRKLSKEPVSRALTVQTSTGCEVELPFPQGGAFAFVQFLGYVTEQLARSQRG